MNKKLFMMIGFPGCGKSTFIKDFFHGKRFALLSTDDYIEMAAFQKGKTYDEVFKDCIKDAEKHLNFELENAIRNGFDIVWDQTNLSKKTRAVKLARIPEDYEKIAVVVQTPMENLPMRLKSRPGKTIPYSVIMSMIGSYKEPTLDEGFSKIIHIST